MRYIFVIARSFFRTLNDDSLVKKINGFFFQLFNFFLTLFEFILNSTRNYFSCDSGFPILVFISQWLCLVKLLFCSDMIFKNTQEL